MPRRQQINTAARHPLFSLGYDDTVKRSNVGEEVFQLIETIILDFCLVENCFVISRLLLMIVQQCKEDFVFSYLSSVIYIQNFLLNAFQQLP